MIAKYKLDNGLSTRQLSKKTNELSESYWNELIKGEKRNGKQIAPSLTTLKIVAKSMDMSLEELLYEMNEITYKKTTSIKLSEANQIIASMNSICQIAHLPILFSIDELTDIQIMELAERVIRDFEIYSYKFK